MTHSEASKLFTSALKMVESKSIQKWARAQRKEWVKIVKSGGAFIAGRHINSAPEAERATLYSAYIVATAIGL